MISIGWLSKLVNWALSSWSNSRKENRDDFKVMHDGAMEMLAAYEARFSAYSKQIAGIEHELQQVRSESLECHRLRYDDSKKIMALEARVEALQAEVNSLAVVQSDSRVKEFIRELFPEAG